MSTIDSVTLEVDDVQAAGEFYAALGVGGAVGLRAADDVSDGFRSYTLSIIVSQPANAELFFRAGLEAGATELKPAAKSLWGYGGVLRAPDGAIWKVASDTKKNSADAEQSLREVVLLIGAADVKASRRFYTDHGLAIDKAYGSRYVQFATPESRVKLALYGHAALAKDAGVSPEGSGSHRLVIHGDQGRLRDPDGFCWEPNEATVAP